jgi:hypothetical protein
VSALREWLFLARLWRFWFAHYRPQHSRIEAARLAWRNVSAPAPF